MSETSNGHNIDLKQILDTGYTGDDNNPVYSYNNVHVYSNVLGIKGKRAKFEKMKKMRSGSSMRIYPTAKIDKMASYREYSLNKKDGISDIFIESFDVIVDKYEKGEISDPFDFISTAVADGKTIHVLITNDDIAFNMMQRIVSETSVHESSSDEAKEDEDNSLSENNLGFADSEIGMEEPSSGDSASDTNDVLASSNASNDAPENKVVDNEYDENETADAETDDSYTGPSILAPDETTRMIPAYSLNSKRVKGGNRDRKTIIFNEKNADKLKSITYNMTSKCQKTSDVIIDNVNTRLKTKEIIAFIIIVVLIIIIIASIIIGNALNQEMKDTSTMQPNLSPVIVDVDDDSNNSDNISDMSNINTKQGILSVLNADSKNPYHDLLTVEINIGAEFADYNGSAYTEGYIYQVGPGDIINLPKVKAKDGWYFIGWCQGGVPDEPTWSLDTTQVQMTDDVGDQKRTVIYALYMNDEGDGYCACGAYADGVYKDKIDEYKNEYSNYLEEYSSLGSRGTIN